jgi:S1-C subfamily serine protease
MDMSEHWHPSTEPDEPARDSPAAAGGDADVAVPSDAGATFGAAIPLHPADSNLGATYPPANPRTELPPTGPTPSMGPGAPTPPAGVWTPHPGSGWTSGAPTGDPLGSGWPGGTGGTTPPDGGWPTTGPTDPAPRPPSSKKRTGPVVAMATVVVAVAVLAGAELGRVVWPVQSTTNSVSSPSAVAPGSSGSSGGTTSPFGGGSSGGESSPFGSGSTGNSPTGAGAPSDITAIASKVDPALVDINTNLSYQNEQAAGTGMVLTSNGEILTNNHVIDGATSISVTDVGNGKTYSAKVVGYDRTGDVAVIQLVNASGLQTISIGRAAAAVGQAVVGVGNAGGTGGTPSADGGSVTALDQSITASDNGGGNSEELAGLLEINAAIQPGDSGGSLVNTAGQVIGMDTAASADTSFQVSGTQAYAIPIKTALSIAKQIEAGNASATVHIGATGFLGVSVQPSASTSRGFGGGGDSGNGTTTSGAVVAGTLSGSPAAQAGLVQGDVITGLNGQSVGSSTDLSNLLEADHPGDTVQLQWTDQSGQTQTAGVKLTSGPPA